MPIHGFDLKDNQRYTQEGLGDISNLREEWKVTTKNKLLNYQEYAKAQEYKIPPIAHSVYITSPRMPYLDYQHWHNTITRLNAEDQNFKHYFWTNNPEVISSFMRDPNPNTIFVGTKPNIINNAEIKSIDEFIDHFLFRHVQELINQGKYLEASDVTRIMVVQAYGGFYRDMDSEIYDAKEFTNFMKSFNFIGGWIGNDMIGNAIFGATKNHPMIEELAKIVNRNLNFQIDVPDYIKFPSHHFFEVLSKTGPIATAMAYYLAMKNANEDLDIMIFPRDVLFNSLYIQGGSRGPLPNFEFEGIKLQTVAADMFESNWARACEPNTLKLSSLKYYNYENKVILGKRIDEAKNVYNADVPQENSIELEVCGQNNETALDLG